MRSKLACDAIKSLFKNEPKHGGEATVEAVQLVAELVKSRRFRVRPAVVEVCKCCYNILPLNVFYLVLSIYLQLTLQLIVF